MRIRMNIPSLVAACLFAVALLACLPSADATVVGFYNFDEGSGLTAADTSGNGFDGTLKSNATLPQWDTDTPTGDAGNYSLEFQGGTANNGVNNGGSRVDIGNPVALQLIGTRTISFWIKADFADVVGGRDSVLGKSYPHEGTYHVLDAGGMQAYFGEEDDPAVNAGTHTAHSLGAGVVTDMTWTHVVHTRDSANSEMRYYSNGVQTGATYNWSLYNPATNPNVIYSDAPWLIGTGYDTTFTGLMDSVGFFDEELTPSEVASMYQLDAQSDNALRAMGMNVPELDDLWDIYAGGLGNSGTVNGKTWTHVDGISSGSHVLGEAWSVALPPGTGQTGTLTFLLLDTTTNSGLLLSEVVPEPSSALLLGLGSLGLVRYTRRRRRRA